MITSLKGTDLCSYVARQLNNFFPDNDPVDNALTVKLTDEALDRLDFCFQKVTLLTYFDGTHARFNHLFSDHYLMYIWYLSNSIHKAYGNCSLANKLYYLNKVMHGFDCMADRNLPDVFLVFHGVGTMLGKANYNDYFVVLNGCTVGSHKGEYPVFGKGVALTANSSLIGKCTIGDRCSISTRTTVFGKDMANDHTAYMDFETGILKVKESYKCYAQQFFNVDLKSL